MLRAVGTACGAAPAGVGFVSILPGTALPASVLFAVPAEDGSGDFGDPLETGGFVTAADAGTDPAALVLPTRVSEARRLRFGAVEFGFATSLYGGGTLRLVRAGSTFNNSFISGIALPFAERLFNTAFNSVSTFSLVRCSSVGSEYLAICFVKQSISNISILPSLSESRLRNHGRARSTFLDSAQRNAVEGKD